MAENRLKLKIGNNEFESEGPADVVQAQLDAFKELLMNAPASPKNDEASQPDRAATNNNNVVLQNASAALAMDKIMRIAGRLVSLTVRAQSIQDGVLVLLLGQRLLRSNDAVTGAEVTDGLRESGQNVPRVDHTLNRLSADGLVITIGAKRGRRYRLTNSGVARAQEIARAMIAQVP